MAESMKGLHRSHRCTEVSNAIIGEKVTVMGWVQKRRNLGSLIFVDLRDRSGILQIVFDEESVGFILSILKTCRRHLYFPHLVQRLPPGGGSAKRWRSLRVVRMRICQNVACSHHSKPSPVGSEVAER